MLKNPLFHGPQNGPDYFTTFSASWQRSSRKNKKPVPDSLCQGREKTRGATSICAFAHTHLEYEHIPGN
jgi:hypothetical protein